MDSINAKARAASLKQQASRSGDNHTTIESRRLNSLITVAQAALRADTPDDLTRIVAQEVCVQLMADQVFLLLQDASRILHIRAEYSRKGAPNRQYVSQSICDKVIVGDTVLIPEALSHPLFQSKESVVALNLRSVMAVPITPVGSFIPSGVLYVCSYTTGELFKESDIEVLKAMAATVSIHLHLSQALAEKSRLVQELEEKAAVMGRMVQVASHQLGTPAQQIWFNIEVAQRLALRAKEPGTSEAADQHRTLDDIVQTLKEASQGVHSLKVNLIEPLQASMGLELLISRLTPRVLMDNMVDLMVARWRTLAPRHQLLVFDRLPVHLKCDPEFLDIALTHVVDNAVKFSAPGSIITIQAIRRRDQVVIVVEDQGIGIPPKDLPYVGQVWLFRATNVVGECQPGGLGLGIYTVRRIVEAHGGTLSIHSELGKGTQVTISLPAFVGSV